MMKCVGINGDLYMANISGGSIALYCKCFQGEVNWQTPGIIILVDWEYIKIYLDIRRWRAQKCSGLFVWVCITTNIYLLRIKIYHWGAFGGVNRHDTQPNCKTKGQHQILCVRKQMKSANMKLSHSDKLDDSSMGINQFLFLCNVQSILGKVQ